MLGVAVNWVKETAELGKEYGNRECWAFGNRQQRLHETLAGSGVQHTWGGCVSLTNENDGFAKWSSKRFFPAKERREFATTLTV